MADPLGLNTVAPGQNDKEITINDDNLKQNNAANDYASIAITGDYALTTDDQQSKGFLEFTGTIGSNANIDVLALLTRKMDIKNSTAGGFDLNVRYAAGGTAVTVPNGEVRTIQATGTNVVEAGGGSGGGGSASPVSLKSSDYVTLDSFVASTSPAVNLDSPGTPYDRWEISIDNLVLETDSCTVFLRFKQGGTSLSGSEDYEWSNYRNRAGNTSVVGAGDITADAIDLSPEAIYVGSTAGENFNCTITIFDPGGSQTKTAEYRSHFQGTDGSRYNVFGGGSLVLNENAIDGVEITVVDGATQAARNIASGNFTLRGRPKTPISGHAVDQTTDATPKTIWSLPLAAGESAMIEAQVTGTLSTGGETYTRRVSTAGQTSGATTTVNVEGTPLTLPLGSPGAGGATFVANSSPNQVELQVTGAAAETWNWVATMTITKV